MSIRPTLASRSRSASSASNVIPPPEELARLKNRYFDLIRESFQQDGDCVAEVPGAIRAFRTLKARPDWRVAIATGGWHESAVMKLEHVGIPIGGVPIATADDHLSREAIIAAAIVEAQKENSENAFSRIVYVGDGLWDLLASMRLGMAFLGRGCGERENLLREGGASHVIPDYLDLDLFFKALEETTTPAPAAS